MGTLVFEYTVHGCGTHWRDMRSGFMSTCSAQGQSATTSDVISDL